MLAPRMQASAPADVSASISWSLMPPNGDVVIVLHQDATVGWSDVEQRVEALMERSLADGKTRTVYVVVGPEGGISDQEIEALTSAGADACILGANSAAAVR